MTMMQKSIRRESRNVAGRLRGGKLGPALAVPFLGGEGGMVSQTMTAELDTVAGRLITPVTGELTVVFVPAQAIDYLKAPDAEYAGLTEVVRQKLLTGNPLFGLENETEISKRLGVKPRSISGVKKVNEAARLAYICAVNFLRKSKYVYATELLHSSTAMAPALISQNILQRMNAALDPDERVNGAVNLDFGAIKLPVSGIGTNGLHATANIGIKETGKSSISGEAPSWHNSMGAGAVIIRQDPANVGYPSIFADMAGTNTGISLTDFYNAEKQDQLIRQIRGMIDANPIDGEEQALRWSQGLTLETSRHPFIVHKSDAYFSNNFAPATDGPSMISDVATSKMTINMSFNAMIPVTELGGVLITLFSVKPDETIADQPHPILSDVWGSVNHVADQFKLDPVPVTMRELDANVPIGSEATRAFYTGHNQLKQYYVNYGFNDQVDQSTVENRTAIWQLSIPASVTPDNINYPETLSHYPFQDQNAEVCIYSLQSQAVINTPLYFGPSPVEEVSIVTDENIFDVP